MEAFGVQTEIMFLQQKSRKHEWEFPACPPLA
jgi:hypothetical protein